MPLFDLPLGELETYRLRDTVCPPSTVFAAFNQYGGDKDIAVYPFNGHEGGDGVHVERQLEWLGKTMPSPLPPP